MAHRRSLLIGFRTRKNIVEGKNIRKQDDGADNFADYWTDSNSEDSTSTISDKGTDPSYTPNGKTHLSKSRSGTKVKDKKDNAKFLNSPRKAVKKLNLETNVHDSPTKKQKLSPKLQQDVYHNSTQNVNNASHSSGQSFVGSEPCSVSNSNVKGLQTPSNILTSKNYEEKDIELNTPKRVANTLRENVSSLSTKSKERKDEISYSLRSSISRNLNEYISTQLPTIDNNDIRNCTESLFSPKRKEKRRKTVVMNSNVSNAYLDTSDNHMLSAAKVVNTDTNLTNVPESEINTLVNKIANERNSLMKQEENVSSSVKNHGVKSMKNSLRMSKTCSVYDEYDTKIIQMAHNSVNSVNVPEKDITFSHSRIVEVSLHNKNNNGVNPSIKGKCIRLAINSSKAGYLRKSHENPSKQPLTINSSKILPKSTSRDGSEIDYTTNNEIDVEAPVSDVDEEDACMSHVSEIQNNDVLGSNDLKRRHIDKVGDKLNTQSDNSENPEIVKQPSSPYKKQKKIVSKVKKNSKVSETFSKDKGNILDTSEKENEITVNLGNKKGKHVNKIHENLNDSKTISNNNKNVTNISRKGNVIAENFDNEEENHVTKTNKVKASETFCIENSEHAADVPVDESESMQNLNINSTKKKQIKSKIPKKSIASKSFSKENKSATDVHPTESEISRNLRDKKEHANNTHENLQASGTFSTNDTESAGDILPKKNIARMIAVKRKKPVSSITGNEISQNLDDKREEHVSNAHENLQASGIFSTNDTESAGDILPKKYIARMIAIKRKKTVSSTTENEISQNLDDNREEHASNAPENSHASGTISTSDTESATDILPKKNIAQPIAIKRKKPVSKISKNLKNSKNLSNVENIVPEINNDVTSNFQDEKINRVNKNKEKQKASKTFSKDNNANEFLEAGNEITSFDTKRKKDITKSSGNLSAVKNNDHPVVSSKKKNKMVSVADEVPLRRSSRLRFPPLATWRNERLVYRRNNGNITFVRHDKGTTEDVVTINSHKKMEIKKKRVPKAISVHDVINKKKVRIPLIKKFEDVPWDTKDETCQYHIKRMFETESSLAGFIEIEANSEKPTQYMPNEDVYLTVLKGEIEVTIEKDVISVDKNTMFVIPRCIPYRLKNISSRRALLAFCVGRFQYLEENE